MSPFLFYNYQDKDPKKRHIKEDMTTFNKPVVENLHAGRWKKQKKP